MCTGLFFYWRRQPARGELVLLLVDLAIKNITERVFRCFAVKRARIVF